MLKQCDEQAGSIRRFFPVDQATNVGSTPTIRALGIAAGVVTWAVLLIASMGSLGIDVTAPPTRDSASVVLR